MAAGLGVVRYRRLSTPIRYLVGVLVFWFVMTVAEQAVPLIFRIHSLWLSHITTLVELAFFVRMFFYWRTGKRFGIALISSFIAFTIVWSIAKFTFEPLEQGDDITVSISSIIILFFSIVLLIHMFKNELFNWKIDARFWVAAGFLSYSAGAFLFFSSYSYMLNSSVDMLKLLFNINWIMITLVNLIFMRALFCTSDVSTEKLTSENAR